MSQEGGRGRAREGPRGSAASPEPREQYFEAAAAQSRRDALASIAGPGAYLLLLTGRRDVRWSHELTEDGARFEVHWEAR